jgi:hypothetical protein
MSGNEQVSGLPVRQRTVAGQRLIYPFEYKWENVGIRLA